MSNSIVWFKNNLRVHDNEVLATAIKASETIIPVYCFDDLHFKTTKYGFEKTGSFRANFLLESLVDLDKSLRNLGSGLIVVMGKPEEQLLKIANLYNANKIYSNIEIAQEEKTVAAKVKLVFVANGKQFIQMGNNSLLAEADLPFTINQLPDVFTSFRKKVEAALKIRAVYETPIRINSPALPSLVLPTLSTLNTTKQTIDSRAVLAFKGGETEALNRLQLYFFQSKAISKYKETRNGMVGANYSSKFSVWLANGCLSAVTIYYELKKYEALHGANESTYWLFFELLWRDYFYFVMQKFGTKLFLVGGIKQENNIAKKYNEKYFAKWINGETGVDFIDANMIELKLTGFMSNRGRQNVASFLVNDLKMDWRYGAAYFEQQLIDYDVQSNWGNWAYIAGVGNDPRPNRYFNIAKQANDYDANRLFRDLWVK